MTHPPYQEIGVAEAHDLVGRKTATLIDVRSPQEYERVRAANATLIPLDELPRRLDELPQEGALLFICATGVRSAVACEYALAAGHRPDRVRNVISGTAGWVKSELPVNDE